MDVWGLEDHKGNVREVSKKRLILDASIIFEAIRQHSNDLPSWWLEKGNLYKQGPGCLHFQKRLFLNGKKFEFFRFDDS